VTSRAQHAVAAKIRADLQVWRDLVAEVGRERMLEPGPMGEWTFKDMAAHLAAWRNLRIPLIEAIGRGEAIQGDSSPEGEEAVHRLNAEFQERDRHRSLDDVLADYESSFERLAAAIEALPESVAHDPNGLPWTDGTATVDLDFTEHLHHEHLPDVRAWLDSRGPATATG